MARKTSKNLVPTSIQEQVIALETAVALERASTNGPDRIGAAAKVTLPQPTRDDRVGTKLPQEFKVGSLPLDEEAYALRVAGYQVHEIAGHLTHSRTAREGKATTDTDVDNLIAAVTSRRRRALSGSVADQFQLELDRVEKLIGFLWDRSEGGDVNAIDRVIKLMGRKAAMIGLDSPEVRLTVHTSTQDLDYSQLSTDQLRSLKDLMALATRTTPKKEKTVEGVVRDLLDKE